MHLLKWLVVLLTSPFWVPTLLTGIGVSLVAAGVIVAIVWFFSLCIIIAILQVLYKLHLYIKTLYKKIEEFKWK